MHYLLPLRVFSLIVVAGCKTESPSEQGTQTICVARVPNHAGHIVAHAVVKASEPRSNADSVFSALNKEDSPGCALALVRHGNIVYQRAYGMASLHYNLPIAPKSYFVIVSTSKQFTSFSLALREEPQQDFRWN
jgi:CubicO group peptidase (beta-lactamase class C family)